MASDATARARPFALSLRLTNRAARSAVQLLSEKAGDQLLEDADLREEAAMLLHGLLGNGQGGLYRFDLQNGGQGREGDAIVNLWLMPDEEDTGNAAALRQLKNWPLVLMGTSRPRRSGESGTDFLVIDLVTLPPWSVTSVSDALPTQIAFDWQGRFASGIPAEVQASLQRMPVHRLQRNRVRLLLDDWGRFLTVRQRIAEAGRFSLDYAGYRIDEAGRRARFQVLLPQGEGTPDPFDPGKVRQARGEDIHLDLTPEADRVERALQADNGAPVDIHDGPGEVLGEIRQLQGNWLEVRLDAQVAAQIRAGRRVLPKKGRLQYRAIGELAQVRRLHWGLRSLLRGRVTNQRLGDFLFDPNEAALPVVDQAVELTAEDLLQPHLNPGQLRAVEGALSAPDLYLIQGPPGTGKTTVIAEICYQVAKRGGRTMVASQANLAVDNAMSKLVHDPSIRALRRGRAESVEEEGQPYLEDQVIGTWLDKIGADCRGDLQARSRRAEELAELLGIRAAIEDFEAARACYGSEISGRRTAAADAEHAHDAAREAFAAAQTHRDALHGLLSLLSDLRASSPADAAADDGGRHSRSDRAPDRAPRTTVTPSVSGVLGASPESAVVLPVAGPWDGSGLVHSEDLRSLAELEAAVALWTGAGVPSDDAASPLSLLGPLDAHFFVDYVRRSQAARESAARIDRWAAEVAPKTEVLGLLCRSWYELVAREQPLRERQRARRAAPAARQARISQLGADIVAQNAKLAALQTLLLEMDQIQRGLLSWLLRRATADGIVDEVPPAFQSADRRGIWKAALGDQRLPSLRGLAIKARESRDAAEALGRMAAQIDQYVDRLKPQISARMLAAAERQPPDWRETDLAGLVAGTADGLLYPVPAAEAGLYPFLQAALTRATATDPRVRIPEHRVAANIVGLRGMAADLRSSQKRLTQLAGVQSQEFTGVVDRLAAGLAADLRAHLLAEQRAVSEGLEAARRELLALKQQARADEQGDSEEDQQLQALNREKERLAQGIRKGLGIDGADVLMPLRDIERTALEALTAAPMDWEVGWREARDRLESARAAVVEATAAHDVEVSLLGWQQRLEAALESAGRRYDAAEAAVLDAAAERQRADAAVAALEEAHSAARQAWLAAYEAVPEALRPGTKSATSSATLDQLRERCAAWEAEHAGLRSYLDSYAGFIIDWANRVTARHAQDEADLRQIYIDNANVIGITCVQAGGRSFSQRYRNFDTVIIDEVSKATPPELLLPMLKGAKVVLVGDSRQLPPMVGPEALQDLAESLGIGAGDLAHLERSLYRDLFERAPVPLKSWLTDQYRMHPQIMAAINQFYHNKLACGIPEPDVTRVHGMAPLIPESTHIAWVQTDWAPAFYESRVGTSRQNDKEVEIIANLLAKMDTIWGGRSEGSPPKEVGVITFYAAQEQALRSRLLNRGRVPRFSHLDLRLGTVDRFQGMERPVIIVSLVCNNARRDIGFARELERINVAFSRAQELLVIVGSRELFCREAAAADAAERYARVAAVVQRGGGMLDAADFIAS